MPSECLQNVPFNITQNTQSLLDLKEKILWLKIWVDFVGRFSQMQELYKGADKSLAL
jgi:hypothetical protein